MGLLRLACISFAGSGTACYAPEIRDCSVQCTSADECAGDQQCSADGYCVSAAETQCSPVVMNDAGAPLDAPPNAVGTISLDVEGKGTLRLVGIDECASSCVFTVPLALPATVEAIADEDFRFDRWTVGPCSSHDDTCTFLPQLTMTVGAKFRRADD